MLNYTIKYWKLDFEPVIANLLKFIMLVNYRLAGS